MRSAGWAVFFFFLRGVLKSHLQMKEADCVFERRDWGTRFACEHDKAVSSVMVSSTGWCRGISLVFVGDLGDGFS